MISSGNNQHNSYCFFFVCVVIVCAIAILTFFGCHQSHMASINRIISCQEEQADVMDSSLMNFHREMANLAIAKEDAMKKILSDSIMTKLPKISAKESQNIMKCVETAIVASTSEYLHSNAINEYESLILSNRWNQLQSDIKSMLELEMSKIQNEHETLGIWAAVLTIVFLIFSFYSLFKTDDLVKQGQDGLDKLTQLKRDADDKLDDLKRRGDARIADFEKDSQVVMGNIDNKLDDKINELDSRIERIRRVFKNQLEQWMTGIDHNIDEKQKEINQLFINAHSKVEEVDQKRGILMHELTRLEAKLNMLEQKYSSIKLEIRASEKEETI